MRRHYKRNNFLLEILQSEEFRKDKKAVFKLVTAWLVLRYFITFIIGVILIVFIIKIGVGMNEFNKAFERDQIEFNKDFKQERKSIEKGMKNMHNAMMASIKSSLDAARKDDLIYMKRRFPKCFDKKGNVKKEIKSCKDLFDAINESYETNKRVYLDDPFFK